MRIARGNGFMAAVRENTKHQGRAACLPDCGLRTSTSSDLACAKSLWQFMLCSPEERQTEIGRRGAALPKIGGVSIFVRVFFCFPSNAPIGWKTDEIAACHAGFTSRMVDCSDKKASSLSPSLPPSSVDVNFSVRPQMQHAHAASERASRRKGKLPLISPAFPMKTNATFLRR